MGGLKPPASHHAFHRMKRAFYKTLVDEVQELEAMSKDPGAVVHGKRYTTPFLSKRIIYAHR